MITSINGLPLSIYMPFVMIFVPLVGYAAIFLVLGFILLRFGWARSRGMFPARYCRGRFLTENEKSFLQALELALGGHYRVFAQVRLAELVDVEAGVDAARRQIALKKIFGKSVDFVLCNRQTFDPIAVIEVDDWTHLLTHRKERDVFVNAVFAQAGLPVVRVPASRAYSALRIREMLVCAGLDG
ncbi:MAG: DUF2726 domain-containing protein [Methylocella sp.]